MMQIECFEVPGRPVERMSRDEIKHLAIATVQGAIYGSWMLSDPSLTQTVFTPLAALNWIALKTFLGSDPLHVYAPRDSYLDVDPNGVPYLLDARLIGSSDCLLLHDEIQRLHGLLGTPAPSWVDAIKKPISAADMAFTPDFSAPTENGFRIKRIEVENLFGRSASHVFEKKASISGDSGTGKTAILQLIAGLTGPSAAEAFLPGSPQVTPNVRKLKFDRVDIEVETNDGASKIFSTGPVIEWQELWEFKYNLGSRSSFALTEDNRSIFVPDINRHRCFSALRKFCPSFWMKEHEIYKEDARSIKFFSVGSGYTRLSQLLLRVPGSLSPVLIDNFNLSLHPGTQSVLEQYLSVLPHQVILVTPNTINSSRFSKLRFT